MLSTYRYAMFWQIIVSYFISIFLLSQYQNVKADYLTAIWNVVNFKEAEQRLAEATK
ncbi:hypothetical protein EV702DRAFT_1098623 [Suillus placidus]|uniref:Manganese/iron superoxide dismutase C-terminal domain-containing protein n=1 Tax=Suillus placidus TaxID=48579 RepID=A0A9P6ZW75_9AGAM|nr:hypothetical protein EV702DRAFT_1098623 [Suillus placidus]